MEHPVMQLEESTSPEEVALQTLADRILSGELAPGTPLHQVALASQLGVNRHHVREILKALANERLVQLRPYATATVAPLSPDDFQELHELRIALEPSIVRRSLPRLTRADILAMRWCVETMADPPDPAARLHSHERFHALLYGRADRPWAVALVARSRRLSRRYLAVLHAEIGWPTTAASHERILDAVESGEAALVESLIADHGREAHEPVFQHLSRYELRSHGIGA
jgi:DNA-binding GntR family transcriptional regulator